MSAPAQQPQSAPVHFADPKGPAAQDPATRQLALLYAHRLLAGTSLRHLRAKNLADCKTLVLLRRLAKIRRCTPKSADAPSAETTHRMLRRALTRYLRRAPAPNGVSLLPADLQRNLALCTTLIGLTPSETGLLRFGLMLHLSSPLQSLLAYYGDVDLRLCAEIAAAATDLPFSSVLSMLRPSSRLRQMRILESYFRQDSLTRMLQLRGRFLDTLLDPQLNQRALLATFVEESPAAALPWQAFDHLGQVRDDVRLLLEGALQSQTRGVNILFYGVTGAGKTALARAVAARLNKTLYMTPFADSDGDSLSSNARAEAFALAQKIMTAGDSLMLFDEFDEAVSDDRADQGQHDAAPSKQWLNDQLENNATPSLYICNDIHALDPAYLRRFTFAVEFRPPSPALRQQILTASLKDAHGVSEADLTRLSHQHPVSLAHLAMAARALPWLGEQPAAPALNRILEPLSRLSPGVQGRPCPMAPVADYRLDLVHADCEVEALTAQLVGWRRGAQPSLSLLLYGPPGTGKSAYLQHLAQLMGRVVVYRKAADLLGCYVGETERNISHAFRDAEEQDAVLIFDEVDSFLRQRHSSMRTWETTSVNAFLQQLEQYTGIVGCTTNHISHLDAAALRRFVFKIGLRHPRPSQRLALFETMLAAYIDQPLTSDVKCQLQTQLAAIRQLSIGDFAVVARQQAVLRKPASLSGLVDFLTAEAAHRDPGAKPVGFVHQALADPDNSTPFRDISTPYSSTRHL